jgi:hypothetical protein
MQTQSMSARQKPQADDDEVVDRQRLAARRVIKAAGLPLYKTLVDQALRMLRAGRRPEYAAKLLKQSTKRLPQAASAQ